MAKILFVDDDMDFLQVMCNYLILEMHSVDTARDGREALELLKLSRYDIVILDLNLPRVDGLAVCREYRSEGGSARVMMLTGRTDINDKVRGFDAGADDYLTKPFDSRELSARIRALLRRPIETKHDVLKLGDVCLDMQRHTVSRGGSPLQLAPKEFALLEFFMRNPNQVFSTNSLLERVWCVESEAALDAVRMAITRLRAKLGGDRTDGPIIETIHRVGYRLKVGR